MCRWQCSSSSRWRNLKSCRGVRRLPERVLERVVARPPRRRAGGASAHRRRWPRARGAGLEAVAGQVVERRAGPAERLDQVQLVGPGPVVEVLVFLLEVVGQLDREQELEADPGMPQELVVEQGPHQGAHLAGVALDQLGLVDPVDQDDDPRVAERVQAPPGTCGAARNAPRRRLGRWTAAAGRRSRRAGTRAAPSGARRGLG